MEGPFTRIPALNYQFGSASRFSNGNWPVFYTALSRTTAERETSHHYGRKAAGNEPGRPVHYSIVRCTFKGKVIDLRPKLPDWPDLVSDDYTFCIDLGREASQDELDGFFAPSARHLEGTTLPIFMSRSVSQPVIEAAARLIFSTAGAVVEVEELL
jgi:hypothetical protein